MALNVHQVHNAVNPVCASLGMEVFEPSVHDMHMPRTQRKHRPAAPEKEVPPWRKTYLREWREKKEISLEKASAAMGLKHSQLSRIERGKQKYCQNVLEAAARLYETSVWQILYAPPDLATGELLDRIARSLKVG